MALAGLFPVKSKDLTLPGPVDASFFEDAPQTRAPMTVGVMTLLLVVGGFGWWGTSVPHYEAVIAPGVFKVEGTRRTVSNFEGGIVREILVRDGSMVKAGDILMRLDDVQSSATLDGYRAELWQLTARDARLVAEIADAERIHFPDELLRIEDDRARLSIGDQEIEFQSKLANLASKTRVLEARIAQAEAQLASSEPQIVAQREQIVLLKREEEAVQHLIRHGLAQMARLYALQRSVVAAEGSIVDLEGRIQQARATASESRRAIEQLREQRLSDAAAELIEVRAKIVENEGKRRASEDVSLRRSVVAPEDGIVMSLRVFNSGAVLRPGDPVLDLVPARDRIVAEVNITPTDIDQISNGLLADVRLPAFLGRMQKVIKGRVTFVASDANIDQQSRAAYFRAYINIDDDPNMATSGVQVIPGMPVEAHIITGERTFMRYLVQPILDSFHHAFR